MTDWRVDGPVVVANRARFPRVIHKLSGWTNGDLYPFTFACGYSTAQIEPALDSSERWCQRCWKVPISASTSPLLAPTRGTPND